MPSKTIYEKCKNLIEGRFKKGDKIGSVKLSTAIMLDIGGQQRTIQQCLKVMMQTKLIKDLGKCHFKIL